MSILRLLCAIGGAAVAATAIGAKMTPAQRAEAESLARDWKPPK